MADNIWALISANVVTTISGVTTANGYATNVVKCEQERIGDLTNGQFPRVEVAGPAITFEADGDTTQKNKCRLEYSLFYYDQLNDEAAASDPASKQTRNVPADLMKALMVDYTRDGKAVMTRVTDAYPTIDFIGNIPVFLWVVTFEVETFIDWQNPYSL